MNSSQMPLGMCLRSGWRRAIPIVEIADDADALCVGRPDGEVDAFHAADVAQMGAELGVALPVRAFAEQVQIVLGEQRREGVGIVHCGLLAALVDYADLVFGGVDGGFSGAAVFLDVECGFAFGALLLRGGGSSVA